MSAASSASATPAYTVTARVLHWLIAALVLPMIVLGIIIPQLVPVLAVVVILKTIFALKTFDVIFMLTQGGPGKATETVVYYAYLNGFKYYNMGFAAAISWLMVVPMGVLTFFYIRFVFRRA